LIRAKQQPGQGTYDYGGGCNREGDEVGQATGSQRVSVFGEPPSDFSNVGDRGLNPWVHRHIVAPFAIASSRTHQNMAMLT
jgi:hypothetical protein